MVKLNICLVVAAMLLSLLVGCGKKAAETTAPALGVAVPVVQSEPGTNAPTTMPAAEFDAQLAECQTAFKARDYDQAAKVLIAVQRARLSDQEAAAAMAQMSQLQGGLSEAFANGDLNAKATIELIRRLAR